MNEWHFQDRWDSLVVEKRTVYVYKREGKASTKMRAAPLAQTAYFTERGLSKVEEISSLSTGEGKKLTHADFFQSTSKNKDGFFFHSLRHLHLSWIKVHAAVNTYSASARYRQAYIHIYRTDITNDGAVKHWPFTMLGARVL